MRANHFSLSDDYPIHFEGLKSLWRRAMKRADIQDLHFHDLRHESTSRFFELGLNVVEVAAITGHKDLKMLQRYTHLRAEDLARKLQYTYEEQVSHSSTLTR